MSYTLRTPATIAVALLFFVCAAVTSAQPAGPLARLAAASNVQAQATFMPKKFSMEFLMDPGPPPVFTPFFETTRSYENGRVSEEITKTPNILSGTFELVNSARTVFSYQGGRLSGQTTYSWDSTAWVPDVRTSYTYNGAGHVTVQLKENYDTGTSTWRNDDRTTTTYSGGIPTEVVYEDWNGTAWTPLDRTRYEEENGKGVIVEQIWSGTAWVNDSRTRLTSLSLAEMAEVLAEFEEVNSFAFIFTASRRVVEFNYAIEYVEETWDVDAGAWVNDSRLRVLSNTAASLQAVEEGWNGTAWESSVRTTATFDGDLVDEVRVDTWDGSAFVATDKTVYTYDTQDNPILIEIFGDEDEDGSFDVLASSRFVVEWVDVTGTAVDDEGGLHRAHLATVQPSPAATAAEVQFYLSAPGTARVRVFDALGREVATLAEGTHAAGTHAARLDVSSLTAGVYFVRLEAAGVSDTRSLVVVR